MPFYSYAANFALLCYDACYDTHYSRFKISLRNFKAHRTTHPDFAAKALAQTPPAVEILSRNFKIPRRCFQNLRCLPLDTAALNLTKHDGRTKYDEQDERNEHNRRHKAEHVEPKKVHGVDRKRAKF